MTACDDKALALQALLDGELDSLNSATLEDHVRECPGCAAALDQLKALRGVLSQASNHYVVPPALRRRIIAGLDATPAGPPALKPDVRRAPGRPFGPWLGGGFGGALAASVVLLLGLPQLTTRGLQDELVASHVRSLQASHLTDIATSNRHVVKPWFNGRIDFAPPVIELAAAGFPLAGGRLDYVDGRTVAVLVYHRRLHTINLFIRPVAGLTSPVAATTRRDSYSLTRWEAGGLEYWAVSDIDPAELDTFRAAFRSGTPP